MDNLHNYQSLSLKDGNLIIFVTVCHLYFVTECAYYNLVLYSEHVLKLSWLVYLSMVCCITSSKWSWEEATQCIQAWPGSLLHLLLLTTNQQTRFYYLRFTLSYYYVHISYLTQDILLLTEANTLINYIAVIWIGSVLEICIRPTRCNIVTVISFRAQVGNLISVVFPSLY